MDRYTKTVLTVIAAALCAQSAQNATTPSIAQQPRVQAVAICDPDGRHCLDVIRDPYNSNDRGRIQVWVENQRR